MTTIELPKNDPRVSHIVRACFPGWKGRRKVKIQKSSRFYHAEYWDGGSKDTSVTYSNGVVGRVSDLPGYEHQRQGNPYNLPMGEVEMLPGTFIVTHVMFMGKDMGIRIYVSPDDLNLFEE